MLKVLNVACKKTLFNLTCFNSREIALRLSKISIQILQCADER